jgi:phosphoglycolate phosphatase
MSARPAAGRWRLLVFDWDGTLVDSIGSIVACMHATTAELGLPELDDGLVRGTIGLGLRDTLATLLPDAGPEVHGRVVECYREHWLGGYADRHDMIPGARETLERLGRAGFWLAVATGKSRRGLERDLARFGVGGHFLASRTPDEAPGKPGPEMVEGILAELGVAAAQALVVGDTLHDLRMAANAGAGSVAVASGSVGAEELAGFGPLAVLPDVTHLPRWLERVG